MEANETHLERSTALLGQTLKEAAEPKTSSSQDLWGSCAHLQLFSKLTWKQDSATLSIPKEEQNLIPLS